MRRLAWLLLLFAVSFCGPKPEDYLQQAREALKAENSELALLHYQKAYETSLDDDFFVYDRDDSFYLLTVSTDLDWLLLIRKLKEENKKPRYFLHVKHISEDDDYEEELQNRVDQVKISPAGKYVLLTRRLADECELTVWNTSDEQLKKLPLTSSCENEPAISDKGQLLYMKKGKVGSYDVANQKDTYPYLKRFPDKPLSKLPAWAYFYFSPQNIPYLTYGVGGTYKFYNLADQKLKLLSRLPSYYKLFFFAGSEHPGMIVGGAGNRKFVIHDGNTYNKVLNSFKIKKWLEAAFVNKERYFYMGGSKVISFADKKSKELPFWARQIHVDKAQNLYFLSPLGTALVYRGKSPNPKSLAIFDAGWDLYESK